MTRGGRLVTTFRKRRGFQNCHQIFRLLWEDRQLNVDGGAFTVRPPPAPTTDGQYEARSLRLRSAFVHGGPMLGEQRGYSPATINLGLAAVRRMACGRCRRRPPELRPAATQQCDHSWHGAMSRWKRIRVLDAAEEARDCCLRDWALLVAVSY